MANLHHALILQHRSGLSEDRMVWTFNTEGPGLALTEATAAQLAIRDFVNATPSGGTAALAGSVGGMISRGTAATIVRSWSINLATNGLTLVSALGFTLGGSESDSNLPAEVALCLSRRATQSGGAADRRRRGRVYIGPLKLTVPIFPQNGVPRPSQTVVDNLIASYQDLDDAVKTAGMTLAIWSRADDTLNPPRTGEMFEITNGYVDDAFDTQRRRGRAPTQRTEFNV